MEKIWKMDEGDLGPISRRYQIFDSRRFQASNVAFSHGPGAFFPDRQVEDLLLMLPGEVKQLRSEGLQSYATRTKAGALGPWGLVFLAEILGLKFSGVAAVLWDCFCEVGWVWGTMF